MWHNDYTQSLQTFHSHTSTHCIYYANGFIDKKADASTFFVMQYHDQSHAPIFCAVLCKDSFEFKIIFTYYVNN